MKAEEMGNGVLVMKEESKSVTDESWKQQRCWKSIHTLFYSVIIKTGKFIQVLHKIQ